MERSRLTDGTKAISRRPEGGVVTVVGGGLAGLVAAISCAGADAEVRLVEAHSALGGRARSTDGPYVANRGPHAAYLNLPMWKWLKAKGLLPPVTWSPTADIRLLADGGLRRTPPGPLVAAALRLRFRQAPDGLDFRTWVTSHCGERAAELMCGLAQVFTFDHDPGRLSAAFVWERLVWVYLPPRVRYIRGGWSRLVQQLADCARALGVTIETGVPVDRLPESPVILATELKAAGELLGDDSLSWEGTRTALLDLGLRCRRGDPAVICDFDGRTFIERFTAYDRSLAPAGHELVQAHAGIRPHETVDAATARIEMALDAGFPGWRERETWRRRQIMQLRTGALDLPGQSWRDRPAVDRGEGIFLAGDLVAAPGLLSEVAIASGREAARLATAWSHQHPTARRRAAA